MKEITTSSGKKIWVFDDLYSYQERSNFFSFVRNSMFTTHGKDNSMLETQGDYNLYSDYSADDLNRLGLLKNPASKAFMHIVDGMDIHQIRVNLSTLNDKNHFHVDGINDGDITILYYPNMHWEVEWGGYTLFMDDRMTDIEYCSLYVPGRVVAFQGSIPHCIAAPTNIAPSYRFSLAIQYRVKT